MNNQYDELVKEGKLINNRYKIKKYLYDILFISFAVILSNVILGILLHCLIKPVNLLENIWILIAVLAADLYFSFRCFFRLMDEVKVFKPQVFRRNFVCCMCVMIFLFALKHYDNVINTKTILIILGKLLFLLVVDIVIIKIVNMGKKSAWDYVIGIVILTCVVSIIFKIFPGMKYFNLILHILLTYSNFNIYKNELEKAQVLSDKSSYRKRLTCMFMTYLMICGIVI